MSPTAVSALLMGSLGLHLSHHPDVPLPRALLVVERLAAQLEARGMVTVVDDPLWARCKGDDGCAAPVRARLDTKRVAFVSIYEGVRTMRVVVRVEEGEHRVELPLRAQSWAEGLAQLAKALVPTPYVTTSSAALALTGPPRGETRWAPWLVGAAGLAATGAGLGFGLSARRARNELGAGPLPEDEALGLRSTQRNHAWAANILVGSGIALLVGGLVFWLTD